MGDVDINTLTMEEYLTLTRGNQAPGVVKQEIGGNVNFEIKSQFMRELRETPFSGTKMTMLTIMKVSSSSNSEGITAIVSPPGYYTRVDNRPPFREKKPSLEELMNKHLEELTRKRAKIEEWVRKLQDSSKINTQNQSASLKNLEIQIKQLTKEYHIKAANELPSSLIGQYKAVFANKDAPIGETSSNETNELHRVSFIADDDIHVAKEEDNVPSRVLPSRLITTPIKEVKVPGVFYSSHSTYWYLRNLLCYGRLRMKDLGVSVNIMPKSMFEHLKLTNLKKTNILVEMADMTKKAPVRIVETILVKINKFLFPSDFIIIDMLGEHNGTMILGMGEDRIMFDMDGNSHHSKIPIEKVYMEKSISLEESINLLEIGDDLFSYESLEPEVERKDVSEILDSGPVTSRWHICKPIRVFYNNECGKDCGMWPTCKIWESDTTREIRYYEWVAQNCKFDDEGTSQGTTMHDNPLLNEWLLDSFDLEADYARTRDDPYSRRGMIYSWHDEEFEEEEQWESGIEKTNYNPPRLDDALPLGGANGSRFMGMIRNEMDTYEGVQGEM
ncbi:putative reverse transcriptase domain-containing protein [Tanacetum coccineum]